MKPLLVLLATLPMIPVAYLIGSRHASRAIGEAAMDALVNAAHTVNQYRAHIVEQQQELDIKGEELRNQSRILADCECTHRLTPEEAVILFGIHVNEYPEDFEFDEEPS